MTLILNIISVLATFVVLEGVIFYTLQSTLGRIRLIKNFAYKEILFLVIGLLLILLFFDFYLPH